MDALKRTIAVGRGETLAAIAQNQGIDLERLQAANPGVDPEKLTAGQSLNIPSDEDGFEPAADGATGGGRATRGVDKIPYQNGRIPSSALTSIGGGHKLYGKAAQNFIAMREAAKRDGVSLSVTDSYRTYDQQVALAKKKGLYSNGGLAAKPGTSKHGLGLAVDLNASAKATAWLKKHATEYGFHTIPREPWHWEYRG